MAFINAIKRYWQETGIIFAGRFKKFVLTAPFWILIIAIAMLVTGIVRYNILTDARQEQYMAELWGQDAATGYRQLTVFSRGYRSGGSIPVPIYSQGVSLKKADINTIRTNLQSVVDAGNRDKVTGLDDEGNPRGWTDCYSTFYDTSLRRSDIDREIKDSDYIPTQVVAVGGNYSAFHPFIYMSGGFLQEKCIDPDQIVLNDALAWQLFRSYDVVGYRVVLEGEEFVVAGVVREYDSSIDREVDALEPRAYIYFNTLEILAQGTLQSPLDSDPSASAPSGTESTGSSSTYECAITCYEAMLPELVKGVANTDIKNAIEGYSETDPQFYVLSNTGRFNVVDVWKYMIPFGEMSEQLKDYEFPYWERASQLTITHLFADELLVIAGSFLLVVGITSTILRFRKEGWDVIAKVNSEEDNIEDKAN